MSFSYFFYQSRIYYNIHQFCLDYSLNYDSLRYNMRKFGSKDKFLDYLHQNPEVIDVLIQRYRRDK